MSRDRVEPQDAAADREFEEHYASLSPDDLSVGESLPNPDADWREVRHERLRVSVPARFEDRSLLTLMEPANADSTFLHSVIVAVEPTELDLAAFAEHQLAQLKRTFPDCAVSSPQAGKTEHGAPFVEACIGVRGGDGPPVRQLQAFFVADGQGYTLTCSAGRDAFDIWQEQVFRRVVRSFRIAQPGAAP